MSTDDSAPGVGIRGSGRRAIWSVLDQIASSLTNFALSIAALRALSIDEFGAFAIVFAAYTLSLTIVRAMVCEPLVIRFSSVEPDSWRAASRRGAGFGILLGAAGAVLLGALGASVSGPLSDGFLALATVLPLLMLQDVWRFVQFARGRPQRAFVNDAVWGVGAVSSLGVVLASDVESVAAVVLAWGLAGSLAGMLGIAQAGFLPTLRPLGGWMRDHGDLGIPFAGEMIVERGTVQAIYALVGAISGLAAVGAIGGARVVLGPINILYLSLSAVAVPEGVRLRTRRPEALLPAARALAAVLAAMAVGVGAVALAVPESWGEAVFGRNFSAAREVMVPIIVFVMAAGVMHAARVGLRVLEAARSSFGARLRVAPLILIGALIGALAGDALGAAAGMAAGNVAGLAIWWRSLHRCERLAAPSRRAGGVQADIH